MTDGRARGSQDLLSPLAPRFARGGPKALWCLAGGMGSELTALHALRVPLRAIYVSEVKHEAAFVLQQQALKYYPGVPVITTGDMRSKDSGEFWSRRSITERVDAEGVPIIIAGWPCDGDAAQNRSSGGLNHQATSTLIEICRIVDEVRRYLNTPREESMPWWWKCAQQRSLRAAGPYV
mgnify:CR=1 FL=1